MDAIKISAPATIANLGPGFDILGLALSEPKDIIGINVIEAGVLISEIEGVEATLIPKDVEKNTAGMAALKALEAGGAEFGVQLTIKKGIRPRSGMGSSAAPAAAAAYGVNVLMGNVLSEEEVVQAAALGEAVAHGSPNADNVAPAVLGSLAIIGSYEPLKILKLEMPVFPIIVVLPEFYVETRVAREILPVEVPLHKLVKQTGSLSSLLFSILKNDVAGIGAAVNGDCIIEPARAPLIPGFVEAKRAALEAGAYGSSISGSGPSIFAIAEDNLDEIGQAMVHAFAEKGIRSRYFVTTPSPFGCKIL